VTAGDQLADALHEKAWALAVCGLRFADPNDPAAQSQIDAVAEVMVAQLSQDSDDRLAAQTCIDLMCLLWPARSPEDCGQADWWRTPLGRLCARSLGRDDAEAVTHSVAAAMLGVTVGTVAQLVHRGSLDRHPDGGVLRASVLQRVDRLGR
jgi:hypothetical protein